MPDKRDPQSNLDLLIDSAISTYAEPRAGLEARVLEHLNARPARPRWLPFVIALPIAACAILLLLLIPRHDRVEPAHQVLHSPAPTPHSAPESSIARASRTPLRQHQSRVIASSVPGAPTPLPKLGVFPTPYPLSPEEQTFVRFVAHAPASEIKSLAEAQQKKDEPLHIAEIQIQPIKSSDPLDKTGN